MRDYHRKAEQAREGIGKQKEGKEREVGDRREGQKGEHMRRDLEQGKIGQNRIEWDNSCISSVILFCKIQNQIQLFFSHQIWNLVMQSEEGKGRSQNRWKCA